MEQLATVSVIVAARNEEKRLPLLLESLKQQSYPSDLFTITVVNDRSEDKTVDVIKRYQEIMPNLHCITIHAVELGVAPKKNAISVGISNSESEIILITDADCEVQPHWISEVVSRFQNSNVGLVQGLTLYPYNDKLFHRFQRLDFFSHSVVAAAGIGAGIPINSNANNFAYRRELFNSIQGYHGCAHIVSGDDDLLLQKVWEQGEWEISYLYTPDAQVITQPVENFSEFIEQRKRWGSKTVYYKPIQILILSLIFTYYCIIAINSLLLITPYISLGFLILLYTIKTLGELFFLIPGTAVFQTTEMRRDIFWASPIQLWVVLISVFGGVFGGFSWKGTKFEKTVKRN